MKWTPGSSGSVWGLRLAGVSVVFLPSRTDVPHGDEEYVSNMSDGTPARTPLEITVGHLYKLV